MPFYTAGQSRRRIRSGNSKARSSACWSARSSCSASRAEPANVAPGTAYRISDLELASRLSFFIWSSIPDDELLDAAIAGKLKNPAVLEQQVRRMLADPRPSRWSRNFAAQWLYLRDIEAKVPGRNSVPGFR